jgi:DNA (cytosine-5)-methyltransferase 1
LGLEKAGFDCVTLNKIDRDACNTLQINRSNWTIQRGDIKNFSFTNFTDIDFISGGFPCQAFSYAGEKLGFEDTRGTLFFEFARAIKEARPKVFLGENVRGLLKHDCGKTLATIKSIITDLGYTLIEPKILSALFYQVPQKRERLFIIGIRNDLVEFGEFKWPSPYHKILVLKDALKAGELYPTDVPRSAGQAYPKRKQEILSFVPQGGYWKDLSEDLQKEYMQGSYFLGGGKTGMARRLAWDEPSLTLTCSPAQKQTERCHPEETRPLTIREYARIQTFPDEWQFTGSISSQYKQIGNAVPVNLAYAVGCSLIALLNNIETKKIVETKSRSSILHDLA